MTDARDPRAQLAWRTGEGRYRNIGHAPPDADLVVPALEDGYLLLAGSDAVAEVA